MSACYVIYLPWFVVVVLKYVGHRIPNFTYGKVTRVIIVLTCASYVFFLLFSVLFKLLLYKVYDIFTIK